MHKTFKQWMQEVDLYIRKVIGLDHECIADWGYYDAYESGETALEAAIQALEFDGTVPEEYIFEILFPSID